MWLGDNNADESFHDNIECQTQYDSGITNGHRKRIQKGSNVNENG